MSLSGKMAPGFEKHSTALALLSYNNVGLIMDNWAKSFAQILPV